MVHTPDNQLDTAEKAPDYHDLAHKRDKLLKSIRQLNGFENFLLPKSIAQLLPAAKTGPIVMLNWSKKGADALILHPDSSVLHLSLWDISPHDASEQSSHQEDPTELGKKGINALISRLFSMVLHLSLWNSTFHDKSERTSQQEDPTESHTRDILDILKRLDLERPEDHLDHTVESLILHAIWHVIVHPILDSLAINVRLFINNY